MVGEFSEKVGSRDRGRKGQVRECREGLRLEFQQGVHPSLVMRIEHHFGPPFPIRQSTREKPTLTVFFLAILRVHDRNVTGEEDGKVQKNHI